MKKILLALSYIPFLYLVYIYAGHCVEGLTEPDNFLEIIGKLGLGTVITSGLVYVVSILDLFVSILLMARSKILPQLPMILLYTWCGLWPWIPRLIELYGGMEPEISSAAPVTVAAVLAYLINRTYRREAY